jgi:hypothetical protein
MGSLSGISTPHLNTTRLTTSATNGAREHSRLRRVGVGHDLDLDLGAKLVGNWDWLLGRVAAGGVGNPSEAQFSVEAGPASVVRSARMSCGTSSFASSRRTGFQKQKRRRTW